MESDASHFEEFTNFKNMPSCSIVQTFPYKDRCGYVRETEECQEKKFYVNYIELLYCGFRPTNDWAQLMSVMVLLSLCIIMFIILGVTADKLFCPALKMVSNIMGLSEHLAGVTLLAFGNGSPDLFTSLASMNDNSRMIYSDLLGGAAYVSCFVGGLLCLLCPFKMSANNVLRDLCFFILGGLYIDFVIVSENHVDILESCCVLLIYVWYLLTVTLDQYLLKQSVKKMNQRLNKTQYQTNDQYQKLDELKSEANIEIISRSSGQSIDIEHSRFSEFNLLETQNRRIFEQIPETLNPFDREEWNGAGLFMRGLILIKIPIIFLLLLLVPVVDYELPRHGWCKLLNTVQIIAMPMTVFYVLFGMRDIFGLPMFIFTVIVTGPLAMLVFTTSRTDVPPPYHLLCGLYSIFGACFVIYSCASETVQILYVIGVVCYSSNAFLGCTLLAWGNSIGDVVSNIALARQGYPRMGYAACFGGPLFNSLLAMGGTLLYKTLKSADHETQVIKGALGENCIVFLEVILISSLIWGVFTNFIARRALGIFTIILYFLFFLYAFLGEVEVLTTYAAETTKFM